MDDADRADDSIEMMLRTKIAESAAFKPKYPPMGKCYNCDEPLADGHRWCDALCQEDHLRREARRA